MTPHQPPLSPSEVFGLSPWPERVRELRLALRGDRLVPPSRFDRSSLRMLRPSLGWPLWRGRPVRGRLVPISNLFNHTPTPASEGWSVRVTQVSDFRGGRLTYDSHNGTDFAVPVGTVVVAPAPGRVGRISREFHRGGLKVFLDHGDGLITTCNHLGRALVTVGQRVRRGEPIAVSAYSGLDGLVTFPSGLPHVHFNVWLGGEYVDPFARIGHDEASLWRAGPEPTPSDGVLDDEAPPTAWDEPGLDAAIAACRDDATRRRLAAVSDLDERAMSLLFERNYFPTRFSSRPPVLRDRAVRRPRLDLPFSRDDFDAVVLLDR